MCPTSTNRYAPHRPIDVGHIDFNSAEHTSTYSYYRAKVIGE
ncbi:MAG: hypothetical protein Q4F47_04180 [Bacteroidaceae bacterium]|nr:hypothetical protein [Bacteroidaceae bacterium]